MAYYLSIRVKFINLTQCNHMKNIYRNFLIFSLLLVLSYPVYSTVDPQIVNKAQNGGIITSGSITPGSVSNSVARATGTHLGQNVSFVTQPGNQTRNVWAGTITGTIDGTPVDFYCIDLNHNLIYSPGTSNNYYVDAGQTVPKITYILNNYYPYIGTGTNAEAASVQIAIWHYSDGVDISTVTNSAVRNRALQIVADAEANGSNQLTPFSVYLDPFSQTIPFGTPAVLTLRAFDQNLDPKPNVSSNLSTNSGTLNVNNVTTDATGVYTPIILTQGSTNSATVTAASNYIIPQGTRYVHNSAPDSYQKIVLATPVQGTVTSTSVVNWVMQSDLRIIKTAGASTVSNNDQITYTVTVYNDGPNDATGVEITDLLPSGIDFDSYTSTQGSYSDATGVWNVGSISSGGFHALTITGEANVSSLTTTYYDLGPASGFNLFVLQDLTQPSSDTQGKAAIGRNASLANYSVGDQLSYPFGAEDVLIVGNNLTYMSGHIYNGNVVYGNSTNLPLNSVSITGGTLRQDNPIDFNAASGYLLNLSNQTGLLAANGITAFEWGGFTLTGTNPFLNVFTVSGSDMTNANNMAINVPNGSVVVVNVTGTGMSWHGGLTVSGTSIENVLYNFPDALNLTISGIDVRGSVLAPKASVNFPAGVINGQMICKNFTGSGQMNNTMFIGSVPAPLTVTNIAEITNADQLDPDSSPANGITTEDDYAAVSVTIQPATGSGGNGGGGTGGGNGGNWQVVGQFAAGEIVWCLENDGTDIYAGTIGGKIYKSADGGLTWTRINTSMTAGYIWSIVIDQIGRIFAGTEQGVFVSADNGQTWNLTTLSGKDTRALKIDANGDIYAGTWGFGVFRSSDNGTTWASINNGLVFTAVHALTFSGNDLFAGTFGGGGVYKLNKNTMTWSNLPNSYPHIWGLESDSNGKIYAATYGGGVSASADGGNTWSAANGSPNAFVYGIEIDGTGNVYASSWAAGVFVSTDGGTSWNALGMGGFGVSSMITLPSQGTGDNPAFTIYAGASNGKIYRLESPLTSADDDINAVSEFRLEQNYPNPFNPATTIKFSIAEAGLVQLSVFNVQGEKVAGLVNNYLQAGAHNVTFNASSLPSGVYIYQINASDKFREVKKMIILK